METEDIAIVLVVLVVLGIVAYILYTNYIQSPQGAERKAQSGQIEAPSPFNPLGKAGNFEIFTEPAKSEVCGNVGPRVAF